jgi:hypothetical protein
MNRKDFFRKLGIGALAVAITPKILVDAKEDKPIEELDDITDYTEMRGFKSNDIVRITSDNGVEIYTSKDGITWDLDKDETNRANKVSDTKAI